MSGEEKKPCTCDNVSRDTNVMVPVSCIACNKNSCRRCWCSYNKYWILVNLLCSGIMSYLFVGGSIFQSLERPNERQMIEDSRLALNQTQMEMVDLLMSQTNISMEAAENLTVKLLEFGRTAAQATEVLTLEENPLWEEWSSAIFFAATVITTIGTLIYV